MIHLVNVAWASKEESDRNAEDFYVDLSQNVSRCPWGSYVNICRNTMLYSFEFDAVLDGIAMLALQGFPVADMSLDGVPSKILHAAAGEAMFAGCVGVCLLAVAHLSTAPWNR